MIFYIGNCTFLTGESISRMVDDSEDLTYAEFIEKVPEKELQISFPDYDWRYGIDLQLKDDYAVSFHQSNYEGMKCCYVAHSSIESVWLLNV